MLVGLLGQVDIALLPELPEDIGCIAASIRHQPGNDLAAARDGDFLAGFSGGQEGRKRALASTTGTMRMNSAPNDQQGQILAFGWVRGSPY
ncbi:MAG: hypothetical protein IPL03_13145 [Sterolibacteriaceae bacterium]|nr:hypothetical protein [Candidatus Methylophosphatis haderslevensis]